MVTLSCHRCVNRKFCFQYLFSLCLFFVRFITDKDEKNNKYFFALSVLIFFYRLLQFTGLLSTCLLSSRLNGAYVFWPKMNKKRNNKKKNKTFNLYFMILCFSRLLGCCCCLHYYFTFRFCYRYLILDFFFEANICFVCVEMNKNDILCFTCVR